jgi:hypothetical protein
VAGGIHTHRPGATYGPPQRPIPINKHCSRCNTTKPVSEGFRMHPSGGRPGARLIPHYMCRLCEKLAARAKYLRSPEAARKQAAARYRASMGKAARHESEAYLRTGKYGIPQEFRTWSAASAST